MSTETRIAVVGCTGIVGQHAVLRLSSHPSLRLAALAASPRSAGRPYGEAVAGGRWVLPEPVPEAAAALPVLDASDVASLAAAADVVLCAVALDRESTRRLETGYAEAGLWVTSCGSAHREDADVPMVIPAVNADHLDVVALQRRRRGFRRGAIAVKSNCSLQSWVTLLHPLRGLGLEEIDVVSLQAVSGAGRTLAGWPEMQGNVCPHIPGEEEKSRREPMKIWGRLGPGGIESASEPAITVRCLRVGVDDGHTAVVRAVFASPVDRGEVLRRWKALERPAAPSAPASMIHVFDDPDRPQPRLDAAREGGMAVSVGGPVCEGRELRFTALAHNAVLGAAGGAIWLTELAIQRGLVRTERSSSRA